MASADYRSHHCHWKKKEAKFSVQSGIFIKDLGLEVWLHRHIKVKPPEAVSAGCCPALDLSSLSLRFRGSEVQRFMSFQLWASSFLCYRSLRSHTYSYKQWPRWLSHYHCLCWHLDNINITTPQGQKHVYQTATKAKISHSLCLWSSFFHLSLSSSLVHEWECVIHISISSTTTIKRG